jgi:hypothetical protein
VGGIGLWSNALIAGRYFRALHLIIFLFTWLFLCKYNLYSGISYLYILQDLETLSTLCDCVILQDLHALCTLFLVTHCIKNEDVFFSGILEQAMEERSQTSSSGGTCKTGSLFSTHSNEMTSHRECTAHEGPVVSHSHREWTAFQGLTVLLWMIFGHYLYLSFIELIHGTCEMSNSDGYN